MKRITSFSTISIIAIACFVILIIGDDDCEVCYSQSTMLFKVFLCGLVVIALSWYFTKRYKIFESMIFEIENQPLLETNEASDGVSFSCEGKIVSDETLLSFKNKILCVYYHYILEKLVKSGKHSHWHMEKNKVEFVPFYIEDEHGRLKIDITNMDDDFSKKSIDIFPGASYLQENSEIDCEAIMKAKVFDVKGSGLFATKTRYRESEYVLKPGTNAFVYGYVEKQNKELVLKEHKEHPLIISRKPKDKYVEEFYKGSSLIYVVHLLVLFGYSLVVIALAELGHMPHAVTLTFLILGALTSLGAIVFTMYNRIVEIKHRAFNALSNIDGELKRRYDLIPNLIKVVKAYAGYEQDTLEEITSLRTQKFMEDDIDYAALKGMNKLESSIYLLGEKYPGLKANENFRSLMIALVDTEERIAYSRTFYNRSIRKYNTLIQQFPFLMLAALFNMKTMQFVNIR